MFFVTSQDIPTSFITWGVFSAAFESLLVDFSYAFVPHFSIIYVQIQINMHLHVRNYVIEKAKLQFKKKVNSVNILSHVVIWHQLQLIKKMINM